MTNQISAPVDVLSSEESHRREVYVRRYWEGVKGFIDAGLALKGLNEERLYRDKYSTFGACVTAEFGISKASAYRMIQSATAAENILELHTPIKPTYEYQMLPLNKLAPHLQRQVWKEAVKDKSPGDKIKVNDIKAIVERITGPPPKRKTKNPPRVTYTKHTSDPVPDAQASVDPERLVLAGFNQLRSGIQRAREMGWRPISREEVKEYLEKLVNETHE